MRILIACYSYTGNTYKIARAIRDLSGGTLCMIYPRQPYPMQFQRLLEQVREQLEKGIYPSLLPELENPENYDMIFAGTPNWCGTLAPPLAAYLAGNAFVGKTILPFYSHCGGWKGNINIAADIRRFCPGTVVHEAFHLLKDGGDHLTEKVSQWLCALGIGTAGSTASDAAEWLGDNGITY